MGEAITIVCLTGIFYAYFGYPICLKLLCVLGIKNRNPDTTTPYSTPTLTVIITARNEEKILSAKLENTISLLYDKPFQIIVASDASDDRTDEIARNYSHHLVELVRTNSRSGKGAAQRKALKSATGEIVVFTDAKPMLDRNALINFAKYFASPEIGAVSSKDIIINNREDFDLGTQPGEGLYVRYEMWLRKLESDFHSLVGLSGSCFAIRKNIVADIKDDMSEDFSLLLNTIKLKLRGIQAADVIHFYETLDNDRDEFKRKVRTVLRGLTTIFAHKEVLNPFKFGSFSWQIISHKLGRWFVPWFAIIGFISAILSFKESCISSLYLAGVILLLIILLLNAIRPNLVFNRIAKIPIFLVISNSAILLAWIKYALGRRQGHWTPTSQA